MEWLQLGTSRLPYPLAEPAPPDATFAEALRGLRDERFLSSPRFQEQQWTADRRGADVRLVGRWAEQTPGRSILIEPGWEQRIIRRFAKMGVPLFAHEVMRSEERQNELFKAGRSKVQGRNGAHPNGFAIDLIHSVKGWQMSDKQWSLIGHQGKEIAAAMGLDLEWGGDWKFYDPAHWEVKGWRSLV